MGIDETQFLEVVLPCLQDTDPAGLAEAVNARWTDRDVASLLSSASVDARRCAALVLGLIGNDSAAGPLSRALHDDDDQVHEMAEHAMWAIWFRGCGCHGLDDFRTGVQLMGDESYAAAADAFTGAVDACDGFAEAYNQRAMAYFFLGRYEASAADCRRAMKLMPAHFGAAAGLGHCLCHLGDLEGARQAYRKALDINPRMPGIASAYHRLDDKLRNVGKPIMSKARSDFSAN